MADIMAEVVEVVVKMQLEVIHMRNPLQVVLVAMEENMEVAVEEVDGYIHRNEEMVVGEDDMAVEEAMADTITMSEPTVILGLILR